MTHLLALLSAPAAAQSFDFDTGNAPIEVVIPAAVPRILETVRPGDAPLVLRFTTIISGSWFDATAPFHPTADAVFADLGHRPASEQTDRNRNIAILYASHKVLNSLLPQYTADWDAMLADQGLDPSDTDTTLDNPIGIGNAAGNAIVAAREHDGMNQLGDEGGCEYNCRPYADYTDYRPSNTAYHLWNPRLWQPDIVTSGGGIFFVQQFVTPQLEQTTPFSYTTPTLQAPIPWKSYAVLPGGVALPGYRQQADEVLAISAGLTDHQKATAEFFDNKIQSLGFSAVFLAQSQGLSLQQFVELDFLTNMAAFDTAITVWKEKRRYNAVRPFTAIEYLYGEDPVTAWGGPGRGTVSDILGKEWRPYLQTANHPEYPSASASFCRAHATAATLYLGSNTMGWSVSVPAGSSLVEPGVTPTADLTLTWPTLDDFADECGESRVWAGVHFPDSVPAGQALGEVIGADAYAFLEEYIQGTAR
ncbi:MAG: vanadium-dependent haloperoxidase [Myxococcota bacterium]